MAINGPSPEDYREFHDYLVSQDDVVNLGENQIADRPAISDPIAGPPQPVGWYRLPGVADKAHYWDGRTLAKHAEWIPRGVDLPVATPDMRTAGFSPPAPGWFRDPAVPGARRYWDGQGWVGYAEPIAKGDVYPAAYVLLPVSRRALIKMGVLTALGTAAVAASFLLSPNCTAQPAGFNCDVKIMTSAAMWLAWVLLVLLACVATALYRSSATGRREPDRGVMLLGVTLAYFAAASLFPPLLALIMAMGAAL